MPVNLENEMLSRMLQTRFVYAKQRIFHYALLYNTVEPGHSLDFSKGATLCCLSGLVLKGGFTSAEAAGMGLNVEPKDYASFLLLEEVLYSVLLPPDGTHA